MSDILKKTDRLFFEIGKILEKIFLWIPPLQTHVKIFGKIPPFKTQKSVWRGVFTVNPHDYVQNHSNAHLLYIFSWKEKAQKGIWIRFEVVGTKKDLMSKWILGYGKGTFRDFCLTPGGGGPKSREKIGTPFVYPPLGDVSIFLRYSSKVPLENIAPL